MTYIWILIFMAGLLWSGFHPKDQVTWLLEVAPALIGAGVMAATYRSFRLTPILYVFILLHCLVLMVGGHYTYAEVPLFDHLFGVARNNYDKVGHFFQGFVPALLAREIFLRLQVVKNARWRNFLIVSVCLAFSAFYELIEWWVAVLGGDSADAFLGTQGYVWDTQSDMLMALIGAVCALISLPKIQDRQLAVLPGQGN